jgi:hypothetical protein
VSKLIAPLSTESMVRRHKRPLFRFDSGYQSEKDRVDRPNGALHAQSRLALAALLRPPAKALDSCQCACSAPRFSALYSSIQPSKIGVIFSTATLGHMICIEDFSQVWNGSDPGWVVVRHVEDREVLQVVFASGTPSPHEMRSLRAVVPALSARPAAEVSASLKGKSEFSLGELESGVARKLRAKCEALGLRVASQGYQVVSHSLVNELSKARLLIEEAAIQQAVVNEAIRQGVPVRHSTV